MASPQKDKDEKKKQLWYESPLIKVEYVLCFIAFTGIYRKNISVFYVLVSFF